jgi:rhomboid protease GlpG
MPEIKALEVAIEQDLRPLSVYLWRSGMPHRIVEEAGMQVVWVEREQQADKVRALYARQQRGEALPSLAAPIIIAKPRGADFAPWRTPVTTVLILLSLIGFFIGSIDTALLPWFTFFEFDQLGGYVFFNAVKGEYWRLLTPIFLHFSPLHIVFNMLWLWDLGRRVELVQGRWRLLLIVVLIGAGSNIAQAVFAGQNIFGGMSGVDYGLLAYCWLWGWLRKDPVLHVAKPVMIAMLAMLLLSMTGITEVMGIGAVANAAHVGGLIMGLLLGIYVILVLRSER